MAATNPSIAGRIDNWIGTWNEWVDKKILGIQSTDTSVSSIMKSVFEARRSKNKIMIAGEEVVVDPWSGTAPHLIYLGTHYFPRLKTHDTNIIDLFKTTFADPTNPTLVCDKPALLEGLETRYKIVREKLLHDVEREGDRAEVRKELHHALKLRALISKATVCRPGAPVAPDQIRVEEQVSDERISELIRKFSAIVFQRYKGKDPKHAGVIDAVYGIDLPDPGSVIPPGYDGKNAASELIRGNLHATLLKIVELSKKYRIPEKGNPIEQLDAIDQFLKDNKTHIEGLDKELGGVGQVKADLAASLALRDQLKVSLEEARALADKAAGLADAVASELGKQKDLILQLHDQTQQAEVKAKAAEDKARSDAEASTKAKAALDKAEAAAAARENTLNLQLAAAIAAAGRGGPSASASPPSPDQTALIQQLEARIAAEKEANEKRIAELTAIHTTRIAEAAAAAAAATAAFNASAAAAKDAATVALNAATKAKEDAEARATRHEAAAEAARVAAAAAQLEVERARAAGQAALAEKAVAEREKQEAEARAAEAARGAASEQARLSTQEALLRQSLLDTTANLAAKTEEARQLGLRLAAAGTGATPAMHADVERLANERAALQIQVIQQQGQADLARQEGILAETRERLAAAERELAAGPGALALEVAAARARAEATVARLQVDLTKAEGDVRTKDAELAAVRTSEQRASEREAAAKAEAARIQGAYDELLRHGAPAASGSAAELAAALAKAKSDEEAAKREREASIKMISELNIELGRLHLRLKEAIAKIGVGSAAPSKASIGVGSDSAPAKASIGVGSDSAPPAKASIGVQMNTNDDDELAAFIQLLIQNKNTPPGPIKKPKTIDAIKRLLDRLGGQTAPVSPYRSCEKQQKIHPLSTGQPSGTDSIKLTEYMAKFYKAAPFCFKELDDTIFYKYSYNTDGRLKSAEAELRGKGTVPFIYHLERMINEVYKSGELGKLPELAQITQAEFDTAIIIKDAVTNKFTLNPKLTPGFTCKLTSRIIPGFEPNISIEKLIKLGKQPTPRLGQVVELWKLTPTIEGTPVEKIPGTKPKTYVTSYVYTAPTSGIRSFFEFPALQKAAPRADVPAPPAPLPAPQAPLPAPQAALPVAPPPQPSIVDSALQILGDAISPPNLPGQPLLSNADIKKLADWKQEKIKNLRREQRDKQARVKNGKNKLSQQDAIDNEYEAKIQRIEKATQIISQGGARTRKHKAKKPSKKITQKRR